MPAQQLDRSALQAFEAQLPEAPAPVGSYVSAVETGNLVFTSGALPKQGDGLFSTGAVGEGGVSVEQAQAAARICAINTLSILKSHLGSLTRVKRVVKLTGFVSSLAGFSQQPAVMNGASDLLVEVFGEAGKHARSTVGVAGLPMDATVELDLVVEIKP